MTSRLDWVHVKKRFGFDAVDAVRESLYDAVVAIS